MATFFEGQRVKVSGKAINSTPPSMWWNKVGIVTFVSPPLKRLGEHGLEEPLEQMYEVRLDESQQLIQCQEHWLEAE